MYRNYKYLGQNYEELVLPVNRRQEVIKLAHEIYSSYLEAKKTKERIKLSFTWPTIASDVQRACESCYLCHRKKRVAVCDRVSVIPIKKDKVTSRTVMYTVLSSLAACGCLGVAAAAAAAAGVFVCHA